MAEALAKTMHERLRPCDVSGRLKGECAQCLRLYPPMTLALSQKGGLFRSPEVKRGGAARDCNVLEGFLNRLFCHSPSTSCTL